MACISPRGPLRHGLCVALLFLASAACLALAAETSTTSIVDVDQDGEEAGSPFCLVHWLTSPRSMALPHCHSTASPFHAVMANIVTASPVPKFPMKKCPPPRKAPSSKRPPPKRSPPRRPPPPRKDVVLPQEELFKVTTINLGCTPQVRRCGGGLDRGACGCSPLGPIKACCLCLWGIGWPSVSTSIGHQLYPPHPSPLLLAALASASRKDLGNRASDHSLSCLERKSSWSPMAS